MATANIPAKQKFIHPGKHVVVLVPFDKHDQRLTNEQLSDEFAQLETPPRVTAELKVGRLPPNVVLYVAHPYQAREKVDGGWQNLDRVHISDPIEISKFTDSAADGDDFLAGVSVHRLIDHGIVPSLKNNRAGRFFRCALSAEKEPFQQTLKLLNQ